MYFCPKCYEAIPEDSDCCPMCNAPLRDNIKSETVVIYASQGKEDILTRNKKKKKLPKPALALIVVVLAIAVGIIGVNEIQKNILKNTLLRDWYDVDDSILKVLDFSSNEIEYRLEGTYVRSVTAATFDYKVVSGSKIKIRRFLDDYETFDITLNGDRNMMTVRPAITSVDAIEYWYNVD